MAEASGRPVTVPLELSGTGAYQLKLSYDATHGLKCQVTSAGNLICTYDGTQINFNPLSTAAQAVIQLTGAGNQNQLVEYHVADQSGIMGSFIFGGDHIAGEKYVGLQNRAADYAAVASSTATPVKFITNGTKRWMIDGTTGDLKPDLTGVGGVFMTVNGTTGAPAICGVNFTTTGLSFAAGPVLNFSINGNHVWQMSAGGHLLAATDNSFTIGSSAGNRPSQLFLAAPAITNPGAGTGYTVNDSGSVRRLTFKCTTTFAAFAAAATTGDKTIATLPAKARIVAVYADTTTKYIGGAVATCTLRLGISAGGVEVVASHDVFTAAVTKGLADADMGTNMTRAAAIQGGYMPSFTGTTTLVARITTTGANTNALTQGSTTWYIEVEVLP